MPSLTDDQIVLRIAKFDGWVRVQQMGGHGDCGAWYGDHGRFPPDFTGRDRLIRLPDWINSYDAIAAVWRKLLHGEPNVHCECMNCLLCLAYDNLRDGYWFGATPREHAEAIAVALGGDE